MAEQLEENAWIRKTDVAAAAGEPRPLGRLDVTTCMAEDDWYGPFARLTGRHLRIVTFMSGGAFFLIAGLIGYETGMQDARLPRWFEPPLWDQVSLGAVLLGAAALDYQLLRRRKRESRR